MQILCIIEILSQTYKKQRPNGMFVYIFFYNFKISHSKGGFGSKGYGYDWKIEEAQKNILRTHTTAVSARMLYKLARNKEFVPQKYFSIGKQAWWKSQKEPQK